MIGIEIQSWVLEPFEKFGPIPLRNPSLPELTKLFGESINEYSSSKNLYLGYEQQGKGLLAWFKPPSTVADHLLISHIEFSIQWRGELYTVPHSKEDVRDWLFTIDPLAREHDSDSNSLYIFPLLGLLWNETNGLFCIYSHSQKVHLLLNENYYSSSLEFLLEPDFSNQLEQQQKKYPDLFKTTWSPIVASASKIKQGLPHCQYGGLPLLKKKEIPPACAVCNSTMALNLQIDYAQIPKALQKDFGESGILQLFHCLKQSCRDLGGGPDDHDQVAYLCRYLPDASVLNVLSNGKKGEIPALPLYPIIEWFEETDGPLPEVFEELTSAQSVWADEDFIEIYEEYFPIVTDKLSGTHQWVLKEKLALPKCKHCKPSEDHLQFIFQYNSNDIKNKFSFADGGVIFLFQCQEHKDQVLLIADSN